MRVGRIEERGEERSAREDKKKEKERVKKKGGGGANSGREEKKEDGDECVIPHREKGAREKGLRRCLLPHCPRLTASNKNVPPLANVTSYYLTS